MKRPTILLLIMALFVHVSEAQLPDNLNRLCLETLEGFLTVKPGEFQAAYNPLPNNSTQSMSSYYNYVYVANNEKSDRSIVYSIGKPLIPNKYKYNVRVFRIGSTWNECVFVVKYFEEDLDEIGYGMETIYAYGIQQSICDSVMSVTNDGFVYRLNDVCYYSTYRKGTTQAQITPIFWPEKRIYKEADRAILSASEVSCRLSEGDAYHCCIENDNSEVHFYYLYRDKYMPYTVLVEDGKVVELFGDYTDENFMLKYSYNGKHWMAVGDERFWVDGEMKSVEGYTITDFLITNNGDYIYKAHKKGEADKSETLVMNGEIIRQHVIIGHFALNAQQKLRFHFLAAGQWYIYDNGQINSVAKESNSVYYPDDLIDNLTIERLSTDGMHKLTYVTGREGVEIDGIRLTKSVPFQVVFDKNNNCFRWNAIEVNKVGKTDLVLYTYSL